jgi:ABC-2 type transport system permease protein
VIALLRKEISGFFSSLTGYLVIIVFLLATGLLLWIFPGSGFNIVESRYAAMDPLFIMAPWVFLFLIPAVTMRMFAEEHRSGTIEMLLTQPLSDLQIVFSKYMAAVLLVLFSLIPTLVYVISVWLLADPQGNIDAAGIVGSYIGLFFLCCGFVAIGIFSSAATNNQIVAFILSLILCFFFYSGFEFIASFAGSAGVNRVLSHLGISTHYSSMSRGVIDSRDVIYFLSLSALFIFLTRFLLEKRKW